jgi:hypothetical protein
MASTVTKSGLLHDIPRPLQATYIGTLVAGIEFTVPLKGPEGAAPYRVDSVITTRATDGSPLILQWVEANNDLTSDPNTITLRPDTIAGGSLDGMVVKLLIEWLDSASGGIG